MKLLDWCAQNGDFGKQILSEWTGFRFDGVPIDINTITHGSGQKLIWTCKNGHEFFATINGRTSGKQKGCPICYEHSRGEIVTASKLKRGTSLYEWCLSEGDWGQQLLKEWAGITEDNKRLAIEKVTSQSNKKVLWICNKNKEHKWYTKVQKRTLLKSGCPYCSNQKILTGENDLETWCKNNNKQYLINQFVGEFEDGKPVRMSALAKSTHAKVKWRHTTNDNKIHEWIAAISDRTAKDSGCPLCTGMNNLKQGTNDLLTWCNNNPSFGNILKEQWIGLDEYGSRLDMSSISYGSKTKLAWICFKCNNPYYQDLVHKLYHKSIRCPHCNTKGTSLPEQIIYRCIKQAYPNTISRGKFQGYEYDISIPELKTCIEYGSYYYHKDKQERDLEKAELCRKHNVRFISILDSSGSDIEDVWESNKIITSIMSESDLRRVVFVLLKLLNIDISKIDYDKALEESLEFMKD